MIRNVGRQNGDKKIHSPQIAVVKYRNLRATQC